MRPGDVDLVLIRAAAHGDLTADASGAFWWRGEPVTVSMRDRLEALTAPHVEYLRVSDVATPAGRHLVAPSGGGRAVLR